MIVSISTFGVHRGDDILALVSIASIEDVHNDEDAICAEGMNSDFSPSWANLQQQQQQGIAFGQLGGFGSGGMYKSLSLSHSTT